MLPWRLMGMTTQGTETRPATYTYTIYDSNPAQSGPCSWPNREDVEITVEDDESVEDEVRDALEIEAAGLGAPDYQPGDKIWANIWDEDGTVVATIAVEVPAE